MPWFSFRPWRGPQNCGKRRSACATVGEQALVGVLNSATQLAYGTETPSSVVCPGWNTSLSWEPDGLAALGASRALTVALNGLRTFTGFRLEVRREPLLPTYATLRKT